MATKHTNTTSARKIEEVKKNVSKSNSVGTKGAVTKGTQTTVRSRSSNPKYQVEEEYEEELVPELSNELILLVTLVVSVLLFLSNFRLSGTVGELVNQVTFGMFGVLAYIIPFVLFFGVAFYLANRFSNRRYVIKLLASIGLFVIIAAMLQLIFGASKELTLLDYYKQSSTEKLGGGLLGGFLCWILIPFFGQVGSYVILVGIAIFFVMILTGKAFFAFLAEVSGKEVEKQKENYRTYMEERHIIQEEKRKEREREEQREKLRSKAKSFLLEEEQEEKKEMTRNFFGGFSSTVPVGLSQSEIVVEKEEEQEKTLGQQHFIGDSKPKVVSKPKIERKEFDNKPVEVIRPLGTVNLSVLNTSQPKREEEIQKEAESILPEEKVLELEEEDFTLENSSIISIKEIEEEESSKRWKENVFPVGTERKEEVIEETKNELSQIEQSHYIPREEPFEPSFSEQSLKDKRQPESPVAKEAFEHVPYGISAYQTKEVVKEIPKETKENVSFGKVSEKERISNVKQERMSFVEKTSKEDFNKVVAEVTETAEIAQEEVVEKYQFPPIDLLSKPVIKNVANSEEELLQTADKLKTTLESFGVRVTIGNVSRGPSVTRYEIQPEQGVKVSKITGLADDIKLNLAAADVRIEAPIPGKAAVGIEVPNKENTAVLLRELIEAKEFTTHSSNIAFTVGKDIGGQNVVADIGKMPHLLIAGSTGSGKSVCINTIIMSILYKAHPNDVKLIMVDPKVVELSIYNGIPHLMIPVVTDPKKASAALHWAVNEMMERYDKFATLGVRDLKGYNERIEESAREGFVDEKFPKLPQIVIIVDELADLMMVAPGEVEDAICRLAQMARAAGLHLILATQRPSVNVITGLIKANVPSRVAFAVSSGIDSRTILDSVGAEKLLGKGDMLFFPSGYPKPVRIQGAFVSDKEVSHVVDFLKKQTVPTTSYTEEIKKKIDGGALNDNANSNTSQSNENGNDEYFAEAGRFIIEKDKASIGMLQRVYKIGFNRAARIMDQLSEAGVVGPEEGNKPRKILMTQEEFEDYLSM